MLRLGPQFGQHCGIQLRVIGDHDTGHQPPGLEVLEEPPHVVLVVGCDQGEGHRQIAQGIGGQQQRKAAPVQFVDAECATELLQNLTAMLGHQV
jgi:hypothetical protein